VSGDKTQPRLAVILGRADEMRAVVYVRLLDGDVPQEGSLRGPRCRQAATLPTTARLRRLPPLPGATERPTCEAVLVEPGFWSPELPNRYQLELSLADAAGNVASTSRLVGICRLGNRDGAFRLDGRRYVPRFVRVDETSRLDATAAAAVVATAREAAAAVWGGVPSAAVCEAADAEGVMLGAELPTGLDQQAAADVVAELAVHPSVGFVVLDATHLSSVAAWRGVRGTMQVGLRVDGSLPAAHTGAEAAGLEGLDFLAVSVPAAGSLHESWRQPPPLPVVVCSPLPPVAADVTIVERRRECDRLQADIAAWLAANGRPAWEPAAYAV